MFPPALAPDERLVDVRLGPFTLQGNLALPRGAQAVVVFAPDAGTPRYAPAARHLADRLRDAGLGTLLVDLLTPAELAIDQRTADLRYDIGLQAARLDEANRWLSYFPDTRRLRTGYFGAGTGAAAALLAAAHAPDSVDAIVSRSGRPDLLAGTLPAVTAPTLLIVGAEDPVTLDVNTEALDRLGGPHALEVLPEVGRQFEEPGALEAAARLARDWFQRYLPPGS